MSLFSPCFLSLYVVINQPAASSCTPVASSSSEDGKGDTPKPKKNRCFMCRKRVGLTGEQARGRLMQRILFLSVILFVIIVFLVIDGKTKVFFLPPLLF